VLEALAAAPERIASLSAGFDDAHLRCAPDADTWSANDMLAHLRACSDMWGKGIVAMLTQDRPTLRYVSPRTWIRKTDYLEQGFHHSLRAFAAQRTQLLALLQPLAPEAWSRGAVFTGTVRGREQTVFSYARRIVDHEAQHLEQLEELMRAAL
jgi:hypothetical protein